MKLSHLLTQYLLTNKYLNLAGIGRFTLEDSVYVGEEPGKSQKGPLIGKISFEQDASVKEDARLIAYISEHSGKMKSLASADLDSHLELARQFLNIGKPYLMEGIGTLSKNKSGVYEFSQTSYPSDKNKENASDGKDMTSTTEDSFTNYEEMFSPKKPRTPAPKRIVTWLAVAGGISLAVFGGYLVYNKTKDKKEPAAEKQANVIVAVDSLPKPKDTLQVTKPADTTGKYKFVIEKAARQRALTRYAFLRSIKVDVKMETQDSILYKLFFILPASPADTARLRDSLQIRYGTRGKTVIELN